MVIHKVIVLLIMSACANSFGVWKDLGINIYGVHIYEEFQKENYGLRVFFNTNTLEVSVHRMQRFGATDNAPICVLGLGRIKYAEKPSTLLAGKVVKDVMSKVSNY